jgi:hypothetical protein
VIWSCHVWSTRWSFFLILLTVWALPLVELCSVQCACHSFVSYDYETCWSNVVPLHQVQRTPFDLVGCSCDYETVEQPMYHLSKWPRTPWLGKLSNIIYTLGWDGFCVTIKSIWVKDILNEADFLGWYFQNFVHPLYCFVLILVLCRLVWVKARRMRI